MGFWRDLWFYLKRLVNLDSVQVIIFCTSVVLLVVGSLFTPSWAVVIFLGILMFSGFRLWRDDREIHEREDILLRGIATRLRSQIDDQPDPDMRLFSFAEENSDLAHHEREFRKHFPSIVKGMDAWCANPGARNVIYQHVRSRVLELMPTSIPESLKWVLANAIANHIRDNVRFSSGISPQGIFEVSPFGFLSINEGNGQWAIFDNTVQTDDVDQAVKDLNALTVTASGLPEVRTWRELANLDGNLRENFRDELTEVIHSNRLGRKHCDRECYESPF
jgi:hypothetical protein